ncbi:MAG: zinc ribbon domain-containing protein [Burkholderiales bacterium]|nr:zinc ribbon domain-containing protein [Burkholderiales bacterium]
MPIFAYRCESCGFAQDVLQKRSDPVLHICPGCGADAFRKQLTAPAFQLKGSGWYVTDFRDNGKAKPGDEKGKEGAPVTGAPVAGTPATPAPAPAAPAQTSSPAPAPAAAPTPASGGNKTA